jgi:GT2 family glycosyltransferase
VKIAVGSIFRNGESYVQRYTDQIDALRAAAPEHDFRLILAEGDSTDGTYSKLKSAFDGCVFKREHGGPEFASVEDAVRFKQSSWVWEGVLERIDAQDDVFMYVEADLLWKPAAILQLLAHLKKPGVDVAVPFCWYQGRHFDSWGLRGSDGKRFGPFFPYHVCLLEESSTGLYPISAAGSCLVMKGEVARAAHFIPEDLAIVGFCQNAFERDYKLWLDPSIKVEHP